MAELGVYFGVNSAAHRENGVKVIVLDPTVYLARTFRLDYLEFPDSSIIRKLLIFVDVFKGLALRCSKTATRIDICEGAENLEPIGPLPGNHTVESRQR